jgi:transcription antitermination factor NusA-like protein
MFIVYHNDLTITVYSYIGNNNKINLRIFYTNLDKSDKCIQNEHSLCEGIISEIIKESKIIKICNCSCHNNMYKLIRNTLAIVNQTKSYCDYEFSAYDV